MAIKSQNQVTIIDVTDAYSAMLTNENQSFAETSVNSGITIGDTANTAARAWRGSEEMYVWVANINPTADNNYISVSHGEAIAAATNLPLTITFGTTGHAVTSAGTISIPILVFSEAVTSNFTQSNSKYLATLEKVFSYSIAPHGAQGAAPIIYELNFSDTAFSFDNKTGTVSPSSGITITATSIQGTTRTNFNNGYVLIQKANGDTKTVRTQIGDGITLTLGRQDNEPETLYYKVLLYKTASDSDTTILDSQTIAINRNGANGEDAYNIDITSSGGLIFKNDAGQTTLTAHVYKGGVEYDSDNYGDYGYGVDGAPLRIIWSVGDDDVAEGVTYGPILARNITSVLTITARLTDESFTPTVG